MRFRPKKKLSPRKDWRLFVGCVRRFAFSGDENPRESSLKKNYDNRQAAQTVCEKVNPKGQNDSNNPPSQITDSIELIPFQQLRLKGDGLKLAIKFL